MAAGFWLRPLPQPVASDLAPGLGVFAGGEQSAGVWSEGLVYGCAMNRELPFLKLSSLRKTGPAQP